MWGVRGGEELQTSGNFARGSNECIVLNNFQRLTNELLIFYVLFIVCPHEIIIIIFACVVLYCGRILEFIKRGSRLAPPLLE